MLNKGRTNQRTLDGPIRLARRSRELLHRVEKLYNSWLEGWQDTVILKLLFNLSGITGAETSMKKI